MSEIFLTPSGAKVLRAMIVSCGSSGCFEAVKRLESVKKPVLLTEIGRDKNGNWLMAAFSRIKDFAVQENIYELDMFQVAHYFGGKNHIEIMSRISDHAGLGQYLGPHVGLVSHVLLPLSVNNIYENAEYTVNFRNPIFFNPNESGTPFYHLGTVVKLPLRPEHIKMILSEQAGSSEFVNALSKIKAPITPPSEYWQALNCTVIKAKTSVQSK